jgi:hypothetical protein
MLCHMKTKNTSILSAALLATALSGLMIVSGMVVSTATAQSNTTETNATTNATMNTSSSSDNPVVMHTDAAIGAIKDGKTEEGRKHLLGAEKVLEGKPSVADSEKRIEAAIQALKDGDSNGSISQAEEAKKSLTA